MTTNEQRISNAVDSLTLVIEDETEQDAIRRRCGVARDVAINALLDTRAGGNAYENRESDVQEDRRLGPE